MNTIKITTISIAILSGSYFVANSPLLPYVTFAGKYKAVDPAQQQDKVVPINAGLNQDISENDNGLRALNQELGALTLKRQSFVPGIVFRIQVLTSREPVSVYSNVFDGCVDVREYVYGRDYRYTVGKFLSPGQSNDMFTELYGKGFEDAFMVAFKDDRPIPVKTAMKIIRQP